MDTTTGSSSGGRLRRRAGRLALAVTVCGAAVIGWGQAATADTTSTIAGYTLNAQALGFQFGFNIPGLIPLPNQNLIEADAPFARTTVSSGPVVDALGAPYYPGDVAANVGTLLQTFGVPLPVPNDTALAETKYPTSPGYGTDGSFGAPPPAGSPAVPNVFNATSHADANGGKVTSSVSDFTFGLPGLPVVQVGSIQASNVVNVAASTVTATATSIVRGISVAGILDISQLTGDASSASDGTQGTPTSDLHVGQVTVEGIPAYIDHSGVHVSTTAPPNTGVTPQQAQTTLNSTLSQDGITVRLADPTTTTTGPEGKADAGGLVVSFTHSIAIPFIPGLPALPSLPNLGSVGIPAGIYTVTAAVTLGSAVTDAAASVLATFNDTGGLLGGSGGLGLGTLGGDQGLSSPADAGAPATFSPTGPGTVGAVTGTTGSAPGLARSLFDRLPFAIPAPVGWVLGSLALCVLVMYPMLLIARWQFLGARRR
jgi:hypothetical protein